jgi:hypothetical protein
LQRRSATTHAVLTTGASRGNEIPVAEAVVDVRRRSLTPLLRSRDVPPSV